MQAKRFEVEYKPYSDSDLRATMVLYELNEDGVIDFFKRNYPMWEVTSVKQKD